MKILVISNNAISQVANNGKTIRSFLKGCDRQDIANLYFGTNEFPDNLSCSNFYRITESDILKSIFCLRFKTYNTHDTLMYSLSLKENDRQTEGKVMRFLKKNAGTIAPLRELMWSLNTWETKELHEWIERFRPDSIFAVLGNSCFTHKIALKLSKRYNLPLSVYFTDDYILNNTATNFLQQFQYRNIKKTYTKSLSRATKAFVIGEKMQLAYEDYFKRPFGILINGINIAEFDKLVAKQHHKDEPFVISYIGGLHLNRWQSLVHIAEISQRLVNQTFDFRVFCIKKPEQFILNAFTKVGIKYCGALSRDGVLSEIEKSHCLIHVESFEEKYRIYTRFSVSTKISEYLASKRGIIVYGPSEIASVELFAKNNLGCVFTEKDDDPFIASKLKYYVDHYNEIDFDSQFAFAASHFNQENMLLKNRLKKS